MFVKLPSKPHFQTDIRQTKSLSSKPFYILRGRHSRKPSDGLEKKKAVILLTALILLLL